MQRALALVLLSLTVCSCGGGSNSPISPTTPAPTTPTPTRIIGVGGNLNFGDVTVGDVRTDGSLVITNSGNAVLTVTGISGPCAGAFTASWTSGTISPGASQTVSVRFAPTTAGNCSGVISIVGDQTGGTNTIAVAANAVAGYSRNLTGRWRGTVGADTIVTLTQSASTLSGSFDSISLKGAVAGSLSNTGQVTLTVTVPGFQSFTLTGQADDAGNTISGQVNGSGFQNDPFTLRRL